MVLIASADAGLRQRWMAGVQNNFTIQQVRNGEVERSLADSGPDVLLLERDPPGIGEVEALSALHCLCPSTSILFSGFIKDVSPYGIIRSQTKEVEMVLLAYGTGAKTLIAETPKKFEMPQLPIMPPKPK